jgi:hypothetical protein
MRQECFINRLPAAAERERRPKPKTEEGVRGQGSAVSRRGRKNAGGGVPKDVETLEERRVMAAALGEISNYDNLRAVMRIRAFTGLAGVVSDSTDLERRARTELAMRSGFKRRDSLSSLLRPSFCLKESPGSFSRRSRLVASQRHFTPVKATLA